jgi:hypothetical protein
LQQKSKSVHDKIFYCYEYWNEKLNHYIIIMFCSHGRGIGGNN